MRSTFAIGATLLSLLSLSDARCADTCVGQYFKGGPKAGKPVCDFEQCGADAPLVNQLTFGCLPANAEPPSGDECCNTETCRDAGAGTCSPACLTCQSGVQEDGGVMLVDGVCQAWCSPYGYCGSADIYRDGGIDCTGCSAVVHRALEPQRDAEDIQGVGTTESAGLGQHADEEHPNLISQRDPCSSGSDCPPNPCEDPENWCSENGVCKVKDGRAECQCDEHYRGPHCTIQDFCDNKDCGKHGTCVPSDGSCKCDRGWDGPMCNIENRCLDTDCGGHGECDDASGTCVCEKKWFGTKCEHYNPCYGVACINGGRCVANPDDTDGFCTCQDGYTGKHCEYFDPCLLTNCGQHGRCEQSTDGSTATCECHAGYFGSSCEIHDPCRGVECGHGTCLPRDPNIGQGECVCQPGWSGPECDVEDKCFGVECGDHGHCDANTGQCVCDEPWFGPYCDQNDPCRQLNCGAHGWCEVSGGNPVCVCDPGFSGETCEVDACRALSCGGHGRCLAGRCECRDDFTGDHCQIPPADACFGVVCGSHGHCVDGTCKCDEFWCGPHCERQVLDEAETASISGMPSLSGGHVAAGMGGLAVLAIAAAFKASAAPTVAAEAPLIASGV